MSVTTGGVSKRHAEQIRAQERRGVVPDKNPGERKDSLFIWIIPLFFVGLTVFGGANKKIFF